MTQLRMPDLGTVEGVVTLVRWLKAEGDTVALGEPLFEVETDKGVSEVEAAIAGVLLRKMVADGGRAGAGETIALIRRPGEPEEEIPGANVPSASTPAKGPAPAAAATSRAPLAPTIRALAEKWGVELSTISPTGPGGRITREDVLAARGGRTQQPSQLIAPAPGASRALSHGQAIVARKVSQSHREKPVYRVNAVLDMSALIALREKGKTSGQSLSWDALFVKAAAMAVTEMPLFRSFIAGEGTAQQAGLLPAGHEAVDIAVAVGIEEELFVPAVRGPAGKSAAAITREIESLVRKAESRALTAQDVEGSCFLVSNLGMFPIDSFDAIIYPDHAAALAVGATTPTPVSDGRNIWIAPMAKVSLAVDHRLINGKTAARFLSRVKNIIETGACA